MIQTLNRVLKSDEVELDGRCHLDIGPAVSQHNRNTAAAAAAKVKLLDNNNEFALIELQCSCGKKTVVKCEYSNASSSKAPQPNTVNNQKKP